MSLRSLRQATSTKGVRTPNTFGAILEIRTAVDEGGQLKLTGVVQNEIPTHGIHAEVAVVFRGDDAGRAVNNLIKGCGSRNKALGPTNDPNPTACAGTFLTLESCYLTDDKQGELPVLSSRWLNTLSTPHKNDQNNRSFMEAVYATSPRVSFNNPDYRDGSEEPKTITIPVAQPKFYARVSTDHGSFNREFDREWGIEKLKRLDKNNKPSVFIDTVEPTGARLATSLDELKTLLTEQLSRGTRATALLRVTDGEEIVDRLVYGSYKKEGSNYVPDPETTLADLLSKNIFRDLPNESLIAGLADGTLKVESIPGYRLNYAGNPSQDDNAAFKLVQDLMADKVVRYEMLFGKDANHFTSVLLPGIARDDTIGGFSPINVIADRPGHFAAGDLVTPNIDPAAIKSAAPAAEDPAPTPAP